MCHRGQARSLTWGGKGLAYVVKLILAMGAHDPRHTLCGPGTWPEGRSRWVREMQAMSLAVQWPQLPMLRQQHPFPP